MKFFKTIKTYFMLSWQILVIFFNLLYGIWKLAKLKYSPVTIFGGTHLDIDSIYLQKASQLARMLADCDIPVLTGGGPGIMEAANCGASGIEKNIITTMGIGVEGLDKELGYNKCSKNNITMRDFSSRKMLLISYSIGFAIFPGGFGTLDELTELLTLIQSNMRKPAPIVLIGVEYWQSFMTWLYESALPLELIEKEYIELITLTDDIDEAFNILQMHKRPFDVLTEI